MDEKALEALKAEIERQDEQLAEIRRTLASQGDVALGVPQRFFDELEEACTPLAPMPARPTGIRG